MRIVIAGATGALGRQLVPKLVRQGHEVVGMTRSVANAGALRELGATPAVADALDPDAVARVIAEARPDAIAHELTALSGSLKMRNFDRDFALTNRLRTEATDHLLAAGRAVGVQRFVAQSYAGWPSARTGDWVKTEDDPLDPDPVRSMRESHAAIRHLEAAVTGADWTIGIALRYGGFYGPGTSMSDDGEQIEAIRKRRFPVIGDGAGILSMVHVADAADATIAALTKGERGVYNIVDDGTARVAEFLPEVAAKLGAKPPMHVPRFVGRLLAGEAITTMMTEGRGASNAKAKRILGWQPAHPSLLGTLAGAGAP